MRRNNSLITILRLSWVILSLFGFLDSAKAELSFQKGMCFAAWDKERYSLSHTDKSLEMLAQTGTEWVAIIATQYQEKYSSKEIFPTQKTPSDESLVHVINQAYRLGLKVMLKPHVDLLDQSDGLWRADIGFQNQADWQEWFSAYLKFILHYARLAEETKVELFCIGTELSFASRQTEFWRDCIIPQIRKVYSGRLIYAANWDEYKNVRFWESLDYVGIDAYFPLAEKVTSNYEEIESGCKKWAEELQEWREVVNKDIIFTEIGYRSCEFSASRPWDSALGGKLDLEMQANCYKAVLNTFFGRPGFIGIYWWYWHTSPYGGGLNNRDFTPQNKPAERVLVYWYRGLPLAGLPIIQN